MAAIDRLGNDSLRATRIWRSLGLLFALALGTYCYAPALHAFFAQDDFAFLAMVRLLHQPWLLFVHDHFPASLYFRPLGVLVWWVICALAGDVAWPQYAVNLLLHLGCVAALYTLLQRLNRDAVPNALWAALFAAHPVAVGTALWLSDRFDLMTTLFSLLALNAALAYTTRPRVATLLAILSSVLLALLSKELGVVGAAAAFVAIALAPRRALNLSQRITALAAIAALTLAWLAYRHAMLTPIGDANVLFVSPSVFVQGSWRWLLTGLEFLARDPRVPTWGAVLLAVAGVLWIVAAAAARLGSRSEGGRWNALAAIATLVLLPGLVQAPVAVHHLGDIDAQSFWFSLIVASRFYHLALAGLICALMLAASPLVAQASRAPAPRRGISLALVLALVALAPAAQRIAHLHASTTRTQIEPLQALETALDHIDLPAHACQVYLLQTGSLWGFAGYSDAVGKGLSATPERIAHCLISTERPPWTYFVRSDSVQPDDYRPLHPFVLAGKPVPWLTLGDVQAMYFTMGEDIRTAIPAQAIFLEYRDDAFVDVSTAVRAGQHKVEFATVKANP